jgi:hypothetical protein
MDSIQIRLPKEIINRIDHLVESGLFQNRSEIVRNIIRNYFLTNNYNGSLPYIVGPFNSQEIEKFQKMTASDLAPDGATISKIKSQLKNVDLSEIVDKL